MENILILNLLGKRFYLPSILVTNYPQTLLGNEILRSKYYRHERKDYYFERNPLLFPYILTYYTLEKKIFCPHHIPIELLENECRFFRLDNPSIYSEMNKIETYQYFPRKKNVQHEYLIDFVPFLIGVLFMITMSMETSEQTLSWSFTYFIELFSTLLLTSIILYQTISKKNLLRNQRFLVDLFSTILSIFILTSENLLMITNHSFYHRLNLLFKTCRLLIMIGHLRILRLMIQAFIHRLRTICILVFVNTIIIGLFSEITFAFERRQQEEDQTNQLTMKTHFDAFWWATSLSFTIGFGDTDSHSTLTTMGRFCSYMLTFFGLLFNGLILQELIKGFLKIYREERRDQ